MGLFGQQRPLENPEHSSLARLHQRRAVAFQMPRVNDDARRQFDPNSLRVRHRELDDLQIIAGCFVSHATYFSDLNWLLRFFHRFLSVQKCVQVVHVQTRARRAHVFQARGRLRPIAGFGDCGVGQSIAVEPL
jgi:hypothetical protein